MATTTRWLAGLPTRAEAFFGLVKLPEILPPSKREVAHRPPDIRNSGFLVNGLEVLTDDYPLRKSRPEVLPAGNNQRYPGLRLASINLRTSGPQMFVPRQQKL